MEIMMQAKRLDGIGSGGGWIRPLALFAVFFIAAGVASAAPRSFGAPEEAARALVQAVKARDRSTTLALLGQDAADWISSGDPAADRVAVARFIAAYDAKHAILHAGDKATLTLGNDDFPFAFPIVREGGRWRFDTAAGKEEMLARRIGENELGVINVLQATVDAQVEYAAADRDGDGVLAYAQKFESSPGKHDGLYWPQQSDAAPSPLGALVARAAAEGFHHDKQGLAPYRGYYYRMLKGQGSHAASGALDYVVRGRAIGGFAVIAYPARYGNSGIMSFMVNQDGKIYQADLGPDTLTRAGQLQQFDPGQGWSPVDAR
jgi:hypothetical protein